MNVIPLESTLTNAKITIENKVDARNCEEGATLNMGWTVEGSNPGKGKRFYSSPNAQTGSGAHLASFSMGNGVFSRQQSCWGVRLTSVLRLVTRLRISGAMLTTFHGAEKENFTFPCLNIRFPIVSLEFSLI